MPGLPRMPAPQLDPSAERAGVLPRMSRSRRAIQAVWIGLALGALARAEPIRWEPTGEPLPLAECFSHFEFLDARTLVLVDPRSDAPTARSFWDLETGDLIGEPRQDPAAPAYLDLRPDRARALALDEHGRLVVVSLNGSAAPTLLVDEPVLEARFAPDGTAAIAVLGRRGSARVARIDLASGNSLWDAPTPGLDQVVLLPSIERVAILEPKYDGSLHERYSAVIVRNAKTGAIISTTSGPIRGFRAFGPQFSSSRFAVVEKTGGFMIVDALDGSVAEVASPWSEYANFSRLVGDGALLAVHESLPTVVKIFDSQTGQQRATISGPRNGFWPNAQSDQLAPSPDLTRIYYLDGATAYARDLATGGIARSFSPANGEARGVAVSPDGQTVAVATDAGAVEFWSANSGPRLGTVAFEGFLGGFGRGESEMRFSPDGKALVVGGGRSKVSIFRTPPLAGHVATIRGEAALVAAARDLDRYFVYFVDGSVEWRAAEDFTLIGAREDGDRSGRALAASSANGIYVTASFSVRKPYTGETIWAPNEPSAAYDKAWISEDGSAAAARESYDSIRIKNLESDLPVVEYALPDGGYLIAAAFASDGSRFAALVSDGDEQRSIRVLDLSDSPPTELVAEAPVGAKSVLFAADGQQLHVLSSNDSKIGLRSLDAATGESVGFIEAKVAGPFDAIAASGEDDLYFIYGYAKRITLIDLSTGEISSASSLRRAKEAGGSSGFAPVCLASFDTRRFLFLEPSGMVSAWNARSGLNVSVELSRADGGLTARVASKPEAEYRLEISPNLIDWTDHAASDADSAETLLPFPEPADGPVFGRVWEFE